MKRIIPVCHIFVIALLAFGSSETAVADTAVPLSSARERSAANPESNVPPAAISFVKTNYVVNERSGVARVTLQRSGDKTQPASVQFETRDGTARRGVDYLAASGLAKFAPLEDQTTIALTILDDGIPGADTYFSVTLGNPSAGTSINPGSSAARVTIADSERPGSVDFTFQPIFEGNLESGTPGLLSVTGDRIALQPDGKVIVAGDFRRVNGVTRNGICRLLSDGSLDQSFDPKDSLKPAALAFQDNPVIAIYSLALQPDGKILLRGNFDSDKGTNYANFIRLNSDGSTDTAFVADQAARPLSVYGHGAAMAVQHDGKILVAEGDACCTSEPAQLARLSSDGSADSSFQAIAVVGADGGWGSTFRCIVIDGEGRTLFEGSTNSLESSETGPQQGLTRLTVDNRVDPLFHPVMDRTARADWGSRTTALIQPDGKILTGGVFGEVNGVERQGLARLNPDGSTDKSFAPEPVAEGYYAQALALQTDQKILAGFGDGRLLRLDSDGSPDLTFQSRNLHEEGVFLAFSDILVQPDGQVLVAMVMDDLTLKDGTVWSTIMRLNGDTHSADVRPRFRALAAFENGTVELRINVVPGRTYSIESSPDLVNWAALTTRVPSEYELDIIDSAFNGLPRFYRASLTAP
jgi:uncharacterized delta-60 repeat protein